MIKQFVFSKIRFTFALSFRNKRTYQTGRRVKFNNQIFITMVRGIKKRDIEYILVLCSHLKEELESITSQMEEYFDERSEAWQDGDGGSVYQEKMMDVEFITGYIEEAQDTLSGWYEE